jgi:exodeoxyribonuclease VII small subunit
MTFEDQNSCEKPLSFETELENLKQIVTSLENQNLDLDEAIKIFEKGIILSRGLLLKLSQAEARLEQIYQAQDESLGTEPLPDRLDLDLRQENQKGILSEKKTKDF